MGLFKSKEQKQMERKLLIKKSMNELAKRIESLKKQEEKYVAMARTAMREELPDQAALAREALRATMSERKRTYKMLLTAEVIAQMKDTALMTKEFLSAVQVLSVDIANAASIKTNDIQLQINKAMGKVSEQTEFLEETMTETQDIITTISDRPGDVITDEDLDKIIYGQSSEQKITSNTDNLEDEIAALKERISKK